MESRSLAAGVLALSTSTLAVASTAPHTVAAPAPGAPTWGPVATIGTQASASRPDVVRGARGVVTVVWRSGTDIVVRRRAAGGVWGPRVRIGGGTTPWLGVDGAGQVTAVWTRKLAGHGPQVMTARHLGGTRWSSPVALSPSVSSNGSSAHGAFDTRLAVAHDGGTLVCWLREADDSGAARVQARYRPPDGAWRRIATLSPVEARTPACAIGDDGQAVVVYTVLARVFAVRRTVDGWTPRVRIGLHAEPPDVAVDDGGDATAVWSSLGEGGTFRPQASSTAAGDPWSMAETLDVVDPGSSAEPVVTMTPQGRTTAAWVRSDRTVVAADLEPGGSWSTPTTVDGTMSAIRTGAPRLALSSGRTGALLLTWEGTRETADGTVHVVRSAYRSGAGAWQEPVGLSPQSLRPSEATTSVGTGGRAVAAWRGRAGGVDRIQVRVLGP